MMTMSQVKDLIANNLTDDRLYNIQLQLSSYIERLNHNDETPRYRIKTNNSYPREITSLDDLILEMDMPYSIISTIPASDLSIINLAKPLSSAVIYDCIYIYLDSSYDSDITICRNTAMVSLS